MDDQPRLSPYFRDVERVSQNWGWFFSLGLLLIALGAAVITASFYTTVFSVILLGLLIMAAGIVQILQAFLARNWSGLFLSLLLGVLYVVVGFLCAARPESAPHSLSMLVAALFLIAGLFRMLTSLLLRFEEWKWVFFNGFVAFLLGLSVYVGWPISGLWIISVFIGIDMILSGWGWVLLALSGRQSKS